ncbi:MAG: hypothetical protein M3N50_04680 [Pseudomonadota bacterium]|nr:hypothetical protein [Pseudomonadota bacterium]
MIIVSQTLDSESLIAVTAQKGLRLPARSSSMGRVMLAFAAKEEQARILRAPYPRTEFLPRFTRVQLLRRLLRVRDRRYDHSQSESEVGVNGLAAAILDSNLNLVAIVGVIGTARQIGDNPDPKLIDVVLRCASTISTTLNARLQTQQCAQLTYATDPAQRPGGPP